MAQLDPEMLSALMAQQDGLDEERYKHMCDNMTEEERLKEAQARSELDQMMQDLYSECYTDKHLDLAGLLMEQYNAAQRNPDAKEMQFTPEALKIVPWAKALVAMQLIQLASQSTTDAEERAKIGEIQYRGIEIIALNYKRCREEITSMLLALADVGAAAKSAAKPEVKAEDMSPRKGSLLPQETFNQMEAEVRKNEARMADILAKLKDGATDAQAMELATEYSTLKAATSAIVGDIRLKDPQVLVHEDWMGDNFTPQLRKIAAEVLASTAYPELKKWANSMDALSAFTQDHTVTMMNSLLHSLSNIYKANRTALSPKMNRKNKSRIGTLQAEGVKLNRAACFIRSFTALDDDDWADACAAFTPEATTIVDQLSEAKDEGALAEWASNVTLIVEYAREVERNIGTVIDEREANASLITTLLYADASGLYQKFLNCFENKHGELSMEICKRDAPKTLLRWAQALLSLSTPLDTKIVDTVAGFARDNAAELAAQQIDPSATFEEGLKYMRDVNGASRTDEAWKAVTETAKCLIPEEMPAEMVEWSFAVTELKGYLTRLESGMEAVIEEYTRNKAEIDDIATNGLPAPPPEPTPPPPPAQQQQQAPPPPKAESRTVMSPTEQLPPVTAQAAPTEAPAASAISTPESGYLQGALSAMIDETEQQEKQKEVEETTRRQSLATEAVPVLPPAPEEPPARKRSAPKVSGDMGAADSDESDDDDEEVPAEAPQRPQPLEAPKAVPPLNPVASLPDVSPKASSAVAQRPASLDAVATESASVSEASPAAGDTPSRRRKKDSVRRSVVSVADGEGEGGDEEKGERKKKKKKKKKKAAEDGEEEGAEGEDGEVKRKKKKKKAEAGEGDGEKDAADESSASPRTGVSSLAPSPAPTPTAADRAKRPSLPARSPLPPPPAPARPPVDMNEVTEAAAAKLVDVSKAMQATSTSVVSSSSSSSSVNAAAPEDQGPRVIQVQRRENLRIPENPILPNKAEVQEDNEEEAAAPTQVFVQPAARTMAQAVRADPQVARGIIFIQPRNVEA